MGALALTTTLFAGSTLAQQPGAVAAAMDAAVQKQLVERIASLLEQEYVFAEVGMRAAAALREQVAGGAFETPTETAAFAKRLTSTLGALTNDKHVRMRYRPEAAAPSFTEATPDQDSAGIRKVEWLAGGVGYLKVDRFYQRDESRAAFNAAFTLLQHSRAVIIDLRDNTGGSDANVLLASYFLREPVLLTRLRWRNQEPMEFVTERTAPSLPNVPVYVLTSARTFSAAEGFAYGLQQQKRITIVGERTAGAANPNRFFPLAPGLSVSIAIGQTVNPVSGSSWEHVGVTPDVEVREADALGTALRLAAARIGSSQ